MENINSVPRRYRLDLLTPAEIALWQALSAIQDSGAHPFLTEAGELVKQARDKVADYVELEQGKI
jgi:hypothetical protein